MIQLIGNIGYTKMPKLIPRIPEYYVRMSMQILSNSHSCELQCQCWYMCRGL